MFDSLQFQRYRLEDCRFEHVMDQLNVYTLDTEVLCENDNIVYEQELPMVVGRTTRGKCYLDGAVLFEEKGREVRKRLEHLAKLLAFDYEEVKVVLEQEVEFSSDEEVQPEIHKKSSMRGELFTSVYQQQSKVYQRPNIDKLMGPFHSEIVFK